MPKATKQIVFDPVGAWEQWYAKGESPVRRDHSGLLAEAAKWLADCAQVEDWGCGACQAKPLFLPGQYVGVDGSPSGGADVVDDLVTRQSETEGLLMRAVLEHNPCWRDVLDNALQSFTRRMAMILFLPLKEADEFHAVCGGIPSWYLCKADFEARVHPFVKHVKTSGIYTLYELEK